MHQSYDPNISDLSEQIEALSRQVLALQSQIQSFVIQNEVLQKQLAEKQKTDLDKTSTQFLLSDFSEIGQFWRHTDSRLENAIRIYLTVTTVAISGAVLLVSQTQQIERVLGISAATAFVLFCAGIFLLRRIITVWVEKSNYSLALNRIRAFFADHSPNIKPYVVLPLADQDSSLRDVMLQEPNTYNNWLITFVRVSSSLLLSFSTTIASWLLLPNIYVSLLIFEGFIMFIACVLFLRRIEKVKVVNKVKNLTGKTRDVGS